MFMQKLSIYAAVAINVLYRYTKGSFIMSERTRLIGNRIRRLRVQRCLSQMEAAKNLGISQAHLSNIESGRNNITLENLLKLHDVLQVPMAEFFVDIDAQDKQNSVKEGVDLKSFSVEDFLQALMSLKQK